jgi:hypothetical protein
VTGAQDRAIERLRKRPRTKVERLGPAHGGERIRVTIDGGEPYEKIVMPSGIAEDPPPAELARAVPGSVCPTCGQEVPDGS